MNNLEMFRRVKLSENEHKVYRIMEELAEQCRTADSVIAKMKAQMRMSELEQELDITGGGEKRISECLMMTAYEYMEYTQKDHEADLTNSFIRAISLINVGIGVLYHSAWGDTIVPE